jgi:hypothetical protein
LDDQVAPGGAGVVSDQVGTGSNQGAQDVQNADLDVATGIAMYDAEIEEDVKMD